MYFFFAIIDSTSYCLSLTITLESYIVFVFNFQLFISQGRSYLQCF